MLLLLPPVLSVKSVVVVAVLTLSLPLLLLAILCDSLLLLSLKCNPSVCIVACLNLTSPLETTVFLELLIVL